MDYAAHADQLNDVQTMTGDGTGVWDGARFERTFERWPDRRIRDVTRYDCGCVYAFGGVRVSDEEAHLIDEGALPWPCPDRAVEVPAEVRCPAHARRWLVADAANLAVFVCLETLDTNPELSARAEALFSRELPGSDAEADERLAEAAELLAGTGHEVAVAAWRDRCAAAGVSGFERAGA